MVFCLYLNVYCVYYMVFFKRDHCRVASDGLNYLGSLDSIFSAFPPKLLGLEEDTIAQSFIIRSFCVTNMFLEDRFLFCGAFSP